MIGVVLLALPLICLLIGIVYLSVNLWKLSKETISLCPSASCVPQDLGKAEDKTDPRSSNITGGIRLVNTRELDEREIKILLDSLILKEQQKNFEIKNSHKVQCGRVRPQLDLESIFLDSEKNIRRDITISKEKILCQLQKLN